MSKKETEKKKNNQVTNKVQPKKQNPNKKKQAPKKGEVKKPEVKKAEVKKEEVKKPEVKKIDEQKIEAIITGKEEVFKDNVEANKCKFCSKYFEKKLTVCPHCHKSQKDNSGKIIITSLLVLLFLSILGNYFIDWQLDKQVSEGEYKQNSKLVSYEDMVRKPKEYKNTNVKVIGKVVSVTGEDKAAGNEMKITIDANLFEGNNSQLIEVNFLDRNYEIGLLEGDLITVYGLYKAINGNIPKIESKYIVFGT